MEVALASLRMRALRFTGNVTAGALATEYVLFGAALVDQVSLPSKAIKPKQMLELTDTKAKSKLLYRNHFMTLIKSLKFVLPPAFC